MYNDFQKSAGEVDLSEIFPVLSEIRKIRRELKYWVRPKHVGSPLTFLGSSSEVFFEPKGVSLIISPWNYPFQLAVGPILSSIAAGNTAILKPSELTPHTSALLAKMATDLFSPDYLYVAEGDAAVSTELLELPFDHIFFTGSPAVGKIVMAAAAKHLTSVTLELGGKSPAIIDETADLKDTAEKIAWGKWLNAGQTCVAPDYLLLHENHKDKFIDLLEKQINLQYGNGSQLTAIVNERHLNRLKSALEEALKGGARIVIGQSTKHDIKMQPLVLMDVPEHATLFEEEIFGPILPIKTYKHIDEAIDFINAKPKPLALYHFTTNSKMSKKMKQECSAGTMCVNDNVIQFGHSELPFGGVNNSGIGKSHGYYGFLAFSNEKAVIHQRRGFTMAKTIYPPYDLLKKFTLKLMLKYF